MAKLIGRLAPSPTGAQHIGNARTFLAAWLSIRSRGGKIILRIEDIDSPRVKSWAIEQAIEDLKWLGLDWDEGPDLPAANSPYIQTQRIERYAASFQQLQRAEKVYPCVCSRSDVAAAASAPHDLTNRPENPSCELIYARTCFHKKVQDASAISGKYSWRFRTESTKISFRDRFAGEQIADLENQFGDFVIYKSDGVPSYQLAVVHDDHEMGITEVLRGDDLIPSTFRQLAIYDFFGWEPPTFVHLPLVVGPDGRRLAKRHGDTRLSWLREQGVSAEHLIGMLARSLGWTDNIKEQSAADLLARYDLRRIPNEPFVFGEKELNRLLP